MPALTEKDRAHVSSHWTYWSSQGRGFGTQRRLSLGDIPGVIALALTSRDRWWVLSRLWRSIRVHRRMGLAFTQDSVRQLCTLALVRPYLPDQPNVLVIGDGHGVFSGLLKDHLPSARIQLVDLSFTLKDQEERLTAAFGPAFIFTHAHDLTPARYDLVVNIASMQEMNPEEIARYFGLFRGSLFYCCNREWKELPDKTVTEFQRYPWSLKDVVFLDELCPWHQWFIAARYPFVRKYDGPIRHRLVRMAP